MGFFNKAKTSMGFVDHDLINNGILARGHVVECHRGSMTTGTAVKSLTCRLVIDVELPGEQPYRAECHHPIQMPYLPQFESGQGYIAVRVDPADHSHIAPDLQTDPPPSTLQGAGAASAPVDGAAIAAALAKDGSVTVDGDPQQIIAALQAQQAAGAASANTPNKLKAAEILATGTPCRVMIASAEPMGMTQEGVGDYYGLVLSVFADDEAPFQVRVGAPVPPEAVALLIAGANLPAKRRADVDQAVCPDWTAAIAEARSGGR